MHSGSDQFLEFVKRCERDWRWWGQAPAVRRPLCSLVALTPSDDFEVARAENGVALRLRCAWTNTEGGMPNSPLAESVRLEVDGQTVQTELVQTKGANGEGLADRYHLWRSQALRNMIPFVRSRASAQCDGVAPSCKWKIVRRWDGKIGSVTKGSGCVDSIWRTGRGRS